MHVSLGLHLFGGRRRTAGITMAPLTKDALERTNSAAEAGGSAPGTSTKSDQAGHLRADAVSLEVPVKVHGSRVTEVVRGVTPHTQPFEEQTSTMIVFPQGAVIRMSTSVNVGQMLVVTNQKSRQDAICRVVKVRTFSNLQGYVEVEFTHKQPGYWSVYFPSEGPATANKSAQPAAVESPAPAIKRPPVSSAPDISWAPAPPANTVAEKPVEAGPFAAVKPPVVASQIVSPAKPEPSFISIGRQEQVQPAASTITPAPPVIPHFETPKRVPAPEKSDAPHTINFSHAPVAEAPSTISMPELHEAVPSASMAEFQPSTGDSAERMQSVASAADEGSHSSFGSLSGGGTLGVRDTSAPAFEGVLDSYTGASAHSKTPSGQNWTLIAVCLLLVFGVVAGGIFYFRPSGNSVKPNSPAVIQPTAAENLNASQTPAGSAASPQVSNPSRTPIANTPPNIIVNGNASAQSHDSSAASNRPNPPAEQDGRHVTSDMMSATLKSHPVSSQRATAAQDDAAP